MSFRLHPQLAADTADVARLSLCRVLLMDDATYPWLILVPEIDGLRDFHDVPAGRDSALTSDIRRASQALATLFAPDKINVAALGNQVPQLHIHVIARFVSDPAWPKPVWGAAPRAPYDEKTRTATVQRFAATLEATA